MKTKYVIIVRHGEYNAGTGSLTNQGKKDVELLGALLLRIIKDAQCGMFYCRMTPRAIETAEILNGIISPALYESERKLFGGGNPDDWSWMQEFVNTQNEFDFLIFVTYRDFGEFFPPYYLRYKETNNLVPERGEAVCINTNTKKCILLPNGMDQLDAFLGKKEKT